MIYDEPVVRRTGDLSLTVEFGDEISLVVSFRVLALSQVLEDQKVAGIIETIPSQRSIGIVVDPSVLGLSRLQRVLAEAIEEATNVTRVRSRIVHIPLLYDDPWSQHCAEWHGAPNSIEVIAEANGITREEVPQRHSATFYWVGGIGFTPGCTHAFPLNQELALIAPKYEVPRKWTYPRILGLGGMITAPYTVRSPGGYQMVGRTPLDWYDPLRKNPTYGDDIVLGRVGDRQRFEPIDLETCDLIRERVILGTYEYQIEESFFYLSESPTPVPQRAGPDA